MEEMLDEVFASDSDGYREYFDNHRCENDKNQKEVIADYEEFEY